MKIVIDNVHFSFDMGCRLLKLKHSECPYPQLADFWDDIIPYTFRDIAERFDNIEQRRVGILCLGLDRLVQEVKPELIMSETVSKTSTWINSKGVMETVEFEDTYELYRVSGEYFTPPNARAWEKASDVYYLRFKDTSTDRMYMLWVDIDSVYRTNNDKGWYSRADVKVTPIDCVAWTITTTVPKGNIEKILRQGDCIMVKPISSHTFLLDSPRHLTRDEYLTLLVAES